METRLSRLLATKKNSFIAIDEFQSHWVDYIQVWDLVDWMSCICCYMEGLLVLMLFYGSCSTNKQTNKQTKTWINKQKKWNNSHRAPKEQHGLPFRDVRHLALETDEGLLRRGGAGPGKCALKRVQVGVKELGRVRVLDRLHSLKLEHHIGVQTHLTFKRKIYQSINQQLYFSLKVL